MIRIKSIVMANVIAIIVFAAVDRSYAQDTPAPGGAPKSASKTAKGLKKKEWEKDRAAKRDHDLALKAHMKHQTKAVRKRMKQDAKKADARNGSTHSKG